MKALNIWNTGWAFSVHSVHNIKAILSIILNMFFFSIYAFCCSDYENMHTLSHNHHQIRIMSYQPLLRGSVTKQWYALHVRLYP